MSAYRILISTLLLALGLLPLAGCPSAGGDDDDSGTTGDDDDATGDDDDSTGDDDDATNNTDVAESEPNDVHPFQDIGVLSSGRTTITGTLTTAGAAGTEQWFAGDIDAYTFVLGAAAQTQVSLSWDSGSDDLDLLLFGSLTANTVLGWNSPQKLSESATDARPESLTSPLSDGIE